MGLDTTHGAWHGPYSSFNRWRSKVAKLVGIDLMSLQGYQGDKPWTEEIKSHNLYPLLNHSDCDGILTPNECAKVADGLGDVLKKVEASDRHFTYLTETFRLGCIDAFEKDENLEFH